jgi:hypothetical protein
VRKTLSEFPRQALRSIGIPTDENDKKILRLRNKHSNARAFIIGNGPSLRTADLDQLQNEITFASNKIYLAFDQTSWRPTYYFVTDRLVAKNNTDSIRRLALSKIMSDDVQHFFPDAKDVIWLHELWRNAVIEIAVNSGRKPVGYFSRNLLYGVDAGWSVVYTQLQTAFFMGIKEVFLLGVDFNFNVPSDRSTTTERGYETAVKSSGESNHFHPDYRRPGELWAVPNLDCQHAAFELARAQYAAAGRSIFNASRETRLAVFPRVDFETALMRGQTITPDRYLAS